MRSTRPPQSTVTILMKGIHHPMKKLHILSCIVAIATLAISVSSSSAVVEG